MFRWRRLKEWFAMKLKAADAVAAILARFRAADGSIEFTHSSFA
jgi:hypothetical protein